MTGLEAIEIIRDRLIEYKNKAEGTNIKCLISPQFAQVRMELQALEIIKEKRVACDLLTNPDVTDYKKYNSHCDKYDFIVPLTQEEFDLLKEVLEC